MPKNKPSIDNEFKQEDTVLPEVDETVEEPDLETVTFTVSLANGVEVELEAIKNREDLDLELLDHAERGNLATFLMGALTPKSRFVLKMAGAKVRDYQTIITAYGEAVGSIE